jgi:hypothetical protein
MYITLDILSALTTYFKYITQVYVSGIYHSITCAVKGPRSAGWRPMN